MTTDRSGADIGQSGRPVVLYWPAGALHPRIAGQPAAPVRSTGRWIVPTRTSANHVDHDAAVAARFPATDAPADVLVAELRRDGDDIPLHALVATVGEQMSLVLAIRCDGVPTVRRTTTVVTIEPAPHPGADPLGFVVDG